MSLGLSFRRVRIVAKSAYQLRHVRPSVRRYQCLIFASDINSPQEALCATLNIFTLLTVACSSTIHIKRTVPFPLGQWLRESATTLRSTYMTCHVSPNASVFPSSVSFHPHFILLFTLTLLRTCMQTDRRGKAANLQRKQCSLKHRGVMGRKVVP